jgi:hypothetical protein
LRGEGLRQEQRRTQINREVAIEPVAIKVADPVWFECGCVVDEEGQRPNRRDGGRHQASYAVVVGKIGRDDAGAPSIARNTVSQLARHLERAVGVDGNRITCAGKRQNDRAANTAGAAGDQRGRWGCGKESGRHAVSSPRRPGSATLPVSLDPLLHRKRSPAPAVAGAVEGLLLLLDGGPLQADDYPSCLVFHLSSWRRGFAGFDLK